MSRAQQTWIIVGALFLAVVTLVYFFASERKQREAGTQAAETARELTPRETPPEPKPSEAPTEELLPPSPTTVEAKLASDDSEAAATGEPYNEQVSDDVTLRIVPTKDFRRVVEWRQKAISKDEDSTCAEPYTATETVTNVTYAWGFVIDRFNTWNEKEGQQEYLPFESSIPRVWHGSLHDIVQKGRRIRVTKQRCGMGQVAFLVSVKR